MARAKALMVLGTGSGVGKSVIAAGFCRVFSDSGLSVAPFKAQNMSNNSFVTDAGGEMGRAQVVQAECARAIPHTDMNPVLLKPAADNFSQVIVQGKPFGNFNAQNYFSKKEVFLNAVQDSYERLAAKHEIIVLEGAGSPAEVNLKDRDFVNMRMAEVADARCVLVGDIDRGGIFASLIGTLDLLSQEERDRIDGLIVNKFRGDRALFEDGIAFLEKRTGKKVLGVLPFERNLRIDEEDSVFIEKRELLAQADAVLDVAVVLLPHMSNFTDFDALRQEAGVRLRYIRSGHDFGWPDLLIIPGTKSTISDLQYLADAGLKKCVTDFVSQGGALLGICGGFQMLGKRILDPQRVETQITESDGFGFFDFVTEFAGTKVLEKKQTYLKINGLGQEIKGLVSVYEIHMGKTAGLSEGICVHSNGRIFGTYYHGLFDSAEFRHSFLSAIAAGKGKQWIAGAGFSMDAVKEKNYQLLRQLLVNHLDISFIQKKLGVQSYEEISF